MYKPVAKNVEEGEKNVGMLINAYDNTIRYTDFLLDSLINTLRVMEDWHSAMIFISDHGESLGENKMFMHGLPMKLAPKVQYEIPFLVWTSEHFRNYKTEGELPAVLEQHYIFHSVLNLLSIQSPAYNIRTFNLLSIVRSSHNLRYNQHSLFFWVRFPIPLMSHSF